MQLVGALLYVTIQTRVDIAYYMSVLCKFMSCPSPEAFKAANQVLLYLLGTADLKIHYSADIQIPKGCEQYGDQIRRNHGFVAFSDASWGIPNPAYGYAIFMANGVVSYTSKTLKSAESTAEAEYAAAYQTTRDIMFLRNLISDLGYELMGRLPLAVDNDAARKIAYNHGTTARNKHFKRAWHLIREECTYQRQVIFHISTKLMRADLLTKALDSDTFLRLRAVLLGK